MPIINENKNEAISTHYNENLQPGMNSRINSGVSSTSSVYAAKYTFPNVRTPKDLSYRNGKDTHLIQQLQKINNSNVFANKKIILILNRIFINLFFKI